MNKNDKIYVAGHHGLVGSALTKRLQSLGYSNVAKCRSADLDLTDKNQTYAFFEEECPHYVFLAAAKVGGIVANSCYPVDFLKENLEIQNNVISACHKFGVRRLLFLGSSCIYPKKAPQPLVESSLLTGPLEPTNRAYALAKISGIELCWSYNRQYGTKYLAAMPTNLYGPGDNYDSEKSHVIPGLIRRFHEAKERKKTKVVVWGSGKPLREFMYSEDMANACVTIMQSTDAVFATLLGSRDVNSQAFLPPLINIGTGDEIAIADLAKEIACVVGFHGELAWDESKPDGTPRKIMDISKLESLGYQSQTSLRNGLKIAYEDFKRNILRE